MTRLGNRARRIRPRLWWLRNVVDVLEAIAWCPCLCAEVFRMCFDPNWRGSDAIPVEEPLDPIPLTPRTSAITLTVEGVAKPTFDQHQSAFLAKLPLELRRQIYIYALGGTNIHLRITERRLHGAHSMPSSRHPAKSANNPDDLRFAMGLLRTCRIMYVASFRICLDSKRHRNGG